MSGLQNIKFVLLVFLVGSIVRCGIAAAGERSYQTIRLESHVSGHIDSMWSPVLHAKAEESGYSIEAHAHNPSSLAGTISPLELQEWGTETNLLEMSLHDTISACDNGDIHLLPLKRILPEEAALSDYVWNGIQPCAIGHSVWATYTVFDATRYVGESAPALLQDFFDTTAFPGKRAIKKSPQAIVEWALLNSGISKQDIYPALSSENIWPLIELLDNDSANFAMVSSYSLVRKIAENKKRHQPLDDYGVIWNRAVAHMSLLSIPKNSTTDGVIDFLRFITDPMRNLQMSTALGYAPVSREQSALINNDYRRALPVDDHTNDLLWSNDKWWREQGGEIEALFRAFVERTFQLKTAKKVKAVFDG